MRLIVIWDTMLALEKPWCCIRMDIRFQVKRGVEESPGTKEQLLT
jgi:hypothetical protein